MQGMLKQAQKMQEEMAAKQEELDNAEYEVQAGGGAVTLKINGKKEILDLKISPALVDPDDVETLADVIIAGVNQAIKTVEDTNAKAMSEITGSMGISGIPGLF